MNGKTLRRLLPIACGLALLMLSVVDEPASAQPPNIVVILADDVGWGDIRANNLASRLPTPNLDRLARNGMRFTNAHSSAALCAASRYSILAGNYQWRGRFPWGMATHFQRSQFLEGQRTLGDILRQAGYATAFVGKWHLGGDFFAKGGDTVTRDRSLVDYSRPMGNGPRAHGFDYSFPLLEGIQDPPYAYFENDLLIGDASQLRWWDETTEILPGGSVIDHPGIGMPYWNSVQVGPDMMTRALGFIDSHRSAYGSTKPFFLYYAATAAHAPHTPPATFLGQPVRNVTAMCERQDMVYELDVAVGMLLEKLHTARVLKDTLILFTSDNGAPDDDCGHDGSGSAFSGYKGLVTEGGHRVPFVVRWGDGTSYTIPKGTVRGQLVGQTDLAATLAALVGVPLPVDQARDSFNLLPVWLGQVGDSLPVRDHLIAEARWDPPNIRVNAKFAYYEGNWKLVVEKLPTGFTPIGLYNLRQDSAELNNLRSTKTWQVKEMLARFKVRYAGSRTAPVSPG